MYVCDVTERGDKVEVEEAMRKIRLGREDMKEADCRRLKGTLKGKEERETNN